MKEELPREPINEEKIGEKALQSYAQYETMFADVNEIERKLGRLTLLIRDKNKRIEKMEKDIRRQSDKSVPRMRYTQVDIPLIRGEIKKDEQTYAETEAELAEKRALLQAFIEKYGLPKG